MGSKQRDCRIFSPDPEFQLNQDERRRRQPHARQPQAIPQRMRREASDREAEVGYEYKGVLVGVDNYMNMQLANAEEFVDGTCAGALGEILIRCNNVMYIRNAGEEGM